MDTNNSQIEDVIAKTCEGISVIDGLFDGKSNELKIIADFCSVYGDQSSATEIVLKSRKVDDRTTEIVIEVAGIVAETMTYESQMIPVKSLASATTTAILAEGGAAHPAGWFMAIVTGGSIYAAGHVVATALSKEAGAQAKIAMKNLIDEYNKNSDIDPILIETTIPEKIGVRT